MENVKIVNIVASATIGEFFNLELISKSLGIKYLKNRNFPGIVYHVNNPKCTVLIFKSGKIVCTGASSLENIQKVVKLMVQKFLKISFSRIEDSNQSINRNPVIKIANIVAIYNLEKELNLNFIALNFGLESVEYEPEQFPGMVLRIQKPNVVALLFGNGKILVTGAKSIDDIYISLENIKKELNNIGQLKSEV